MQAPGPQSVAGGYVTRGDTGGSFVGKDITPEWYSYDHGPIHFISYRSAALLFPPSLLCPCSMCSQAAWSARLSCFKCGTVDEGGCGR